MSKQLSGVVYLDSSTVLHSLATTKSSNRSNGQLLIPLTGYQPGISIEMRADIDDLVMIAHRLLDIVEQHTRTMCERCDSDINVTMIDLGENVCEACLTAVPQIIDLDESNSAHTYTLHDGDTGEPIRPATAWEATRSLLQADNDSGHGFIIVDDRKVFVR